MEGSLFKIPAGESPWYKRAGMDVLQLSKTSSAPPSRNGTRIPSERCP
jgi:hypothetical protein